MTLLRGTDHPGLVNFHLVVLALTVIVVGGSGSWIGALIGSLIFVWLPTWLVFIGEWEEIVYGVIVALAAIFLPSGVLGVAKNLWHRFRTREGRARLKAGGGTPAGETGETGGRGLVPSVEGEA